MAVADTGVTVEERYDGVLGEEQTRSPEGAATRDAWVWPGGYTRTWAAAVDPLHGGMPGSVTEIEA